MKLIGFNEETGEFTVENPELLSDWYNIGKVKHYNRFDKENKILYKIYKFYQKEYKKQYLYHRLTNIYRTYFDNENDFFNELNNRLENKTISDWI